METTTEEIAVANPVLRDDPELDSLRESAEALDRGDTPSAKEAEQRAPAKPEPVVEPKDEGKPDNSEITLETKPEEKKERERDETGKFVKKDGEVAAEGTKPEAKETNFERAKKEQERREKSWDNLNKEKEEFRKQRETEIARINEERRQLQSSMQTRNGDKPSEGQYTPEDYEAAAREFDASGDTGLAQQARDASKALRIVEQQTQQQREVQRFKQEYIQAAQAVIEKEPDAAKAETPLFKAIAETFDAAPILWRVPNGFAMALEHAKAKMDARLVSELKEANKNLQAEVARLNGNMQPAGSGPTSPSSPKRFEELGTEEQMAQLKATAERLDGIA